MTSLRPHPRPSRSRAPRLVLSAALAAVAGCSGMFSSGPADTAQDSEKVCTQIGCESGLAVRLPSAPLGAWRIEVTDLATGTSRSYDCPANAQCSTTAMLSDFTPTRARVRVTTSRGTRDTEVTPSYEMRRPNGADCPPVCRQATVEVPLPA